MTLMNEGPSQAHSFIHSLIHSTSTYAVTTVGQVLWKTLGNATIKDTVLGAPGGLSQ